MLGVVTALDGLHILLFHVEQQKGWHWRWRLVGNLPAPYLEWREGRAAYPLVIIQPEQAFSQVEVQWKRRKRNAWSQTTLHRMKRHQTELELSVSEDFTLTGGKHSAIAAVRGQPARYFFAAPDPLVLTPGRPVRVTGFADAPVPANIFYAAGDFTAIQGPLTVRNVGPSSDWFEPVEGGFVLTRIDGLEKRRLFTVS